MTHYAMYSDESGDAGPQSKVAFARAGVVCASDAYSGLVDELHAFKQRWFSKARADRTKLVAREIAAGRARIDRPDEFGGFISELDALLRQLEFTVQWVVIDVRRMRLKELFFSLSFVMVVERFNFFLENRKADVDSGELVFHRVSQHLDKKQRGGSGRKVRSEDKVLLDELWKMHNLRLPGKLRRKQTTMLTPEVRFLPAEYNEGLQLADLAAYAIYRAYTSIGKPAPSNHFYDAFREKADRGPRGRLKGCGLKVFPDEGMANFDLRGFSKRRLAEIGRQS